METEDFIIEFRERIGDTTGSVSDQSIISFLNTALRRIGRTPGLDKLFRRRDSFELAAINDDGTYSASWDLGKIGKIIDIPNIKFMCASDSGVRRIPVKYVDFARFFNTVNVPEQRVPGYPEIFTIEQIGSFNRIIFDRPSKGLVALEMVYAAFHPRILGRDSMIEIAYEYCDILMEYVIILHKIETTDMSTGRALYEDLDLLVIETREMLARGQSGAEYKRMRRSF